MANNDDVQIKAMVAMAFIGLVLLLCIIGLLWSAFLWFFS